MRKLFFAALIPTVLVAALAAQEPDAVPSPPPGVRLSDLVERSEVRLLLVDVVVTDKKGNVITDLRREDFRLFLDGREVGIDSFEVRAPRRPEAEIVSEDVEGVDETIEAPPDAASAPVAGQKTILLFDASNSRSSNQIRIRERAIEFLDSGALSFDQVMVVSLANDLRVHQTMTGDRDRWIAAIDAMVEDRSELDTWVDMEGFRLGRISDSVAEARRNPSPINIASNCSAAWTIARGYANEEKQRATATLGVLTGLVEALGGIDGKKSIVLFSEGFRPIPGELYHAMVIKSICGSGIYRWSLWPYSLVDDVATFVELANAANVQFHTVNPKITGAYDVAVASGSVGGTPNDLLTDLAAGTGGARTVMTASIEKNVRRLQSLMHNYYILGHSLEQAAPDGATYNIRIETTRRGLTVHHRQSFADLDWREREERMIAGAAELPELYNDIPLSVNTYLFREQRRGYGAYFDIAVELAHLSWVPTALGEIGEVEFLGVIIDRKGKVRDPYREALTLKSDAGSTAPRLRYRARTKPLRPGPYELIAVVRDVGSGRVGAERHRFEVPKPAAKKISMTGVVLARLAGDEMVYGSLFPYMETDLPPDSFRREGMVPVNGSPLSRGDTLALFFQVYRPEGGEEMEPAPEPVVRLLRGDEIIATWHPARLQVRASADKAGIPYGARIALEKFPPDSYRLRLEPSAGPYPVELAIEIPIEIE